MMEAVIFDMDGVIVDSHPVHMEAWRIFLESVGKQVTQADLEFVLDGRKKEDILRHFLGDLSPEKVIAYGRRKEMIFREQSSRLLPIGGLPELLDCLRQAGVRMAVASSGSKRRVRYILDYLGLQHQFAAVVTGDDVQNGKPDPAIFLMACSELLCRPADVLVVEDSVSGVIAARSAGMKCLAVTSNGRTRLLLEAGAQKVVPDFVGLSPEQLRQLWATPSGAPVSSES